MTSPASAPVFGRRTQAQKRVPFTLISYRGEEEIEHSFTARAAIDASTALQANSADPQVAAKAIQNLLLRVLVDDDGVSERATVRQIGDRPDDEDDETDDGGSDDGEVVVYGTDDAADSDLWVIGDDESTTFPSRSLALKHAAEHASSLRRFAELMDDPRHWVELTALKGLVKYLNKESSTGRPTKPSGASSRPRTAKRRR